jgi:hypothetical protein
MSRVQPEVTNASTPSEVTEKTDEQPASIVKETVVDEFFTDVGKSTITYKITHKMAYHPIKVSCCMFLFILGVAMITIVLGIAETSEASEFDWVISDTEESENLDALHNAIIRVDLVSSTTVLERTNILDAKFFYIYESSDGKDIYTAANLLHMCNIESTMLGSDGWSDVCHLTGGVCNLPTTSIVVYFYDFQTVNDWNCTLLNDPPNNQIHV